MRIIMSLKVLFTGSVLFVYLTLDCSAQIDSSFIEVFDQNLILKAFTYNNILNLTISEPKPIGEINYKSNNPINVGIGISHPKIPVDISIGYHIGSRLDDQYLKTKSLDLQLHKYGRRYVTDIFIQHYQGFYIEDDKDIDNANRPDLSILELGISGQYIFNGQKFSYRAAFNQNEKQLKSSGSFLLGSGIYLFNIGLDSLTVYSNKKAIKSYQFGLNIGYSYNWVFNKHFLANGSLTFGANIGNENMKAFFNDQLYVTPLSLVRLSFIYSKKNWFLGISGVVNTVTLVYTKDSEIDLDFGRLNITYTRKFDLKKKRNTIGKLL